MVTLYTVKKRTSVFIPVHIYIRIGSNCDENG